MKWFLVVYFVVGSEWVSAEKLGKEGWYRIQYPDAESCINAQWEFTSITNPDAIRAIVDQQFDVGRQIIAKGLIPIIEPEVDINAPDKAAAEDTLRDELLSHLDELEEGQDVIFKLTLPETANLYRACIDHPRVLKVVALSGGYSREEANRRLGENNDMIASFSRALAEGLSASQSDEEFSQTLGASIDAIVAASRT